MKPEDIFILTHKEHAQCDLTSDVVCDERERETRPSRATTHNADIVRYASLLWLSLVCLENWSWRLVVPGVFSSFLFLLSSKAVSSKIDTIIYLIVVVTLVSNIVTIGHPSDVDGIALSTF